MFRTIEDFKKAWACRSKATLNLYTHLTDKALAHQVSAEGRTLGAIAWHNVTTPGEMLGRTGLVIEAPTLHEAIPTSVKQICAAYETGARSVIDEVCKNWTDASLLEEDDMYGQKWLRGQTLGILIDHQSHHCGQMTVLMRQEGLPVSGMCGPSREEWIQYGMQPMK